MSSHSVHGHNFLGRFGIPSKAERMERRLAKIGHQPPNGYAYQNLPAGWRYPNQVPVYREEQEAWIPMKISEIVSRVKTLPQSHQQAGAITPIPQTRDTDGIPRLPQLPMPRDNREVISELETSKGLPGFPRWLVDLRNNPPAPVANPISGASFSPLETVRVDRGSQPVRVVQDLGIDQNPTWKSPSKTEQEVATLLARVNSVNLPPVEILHLDPLAREANASTDKTGSGQVDKNDAWLNSRAVEIRTEPKPVSAFIELLNSPTEKQPAITREIAEKHKKESE
jgi:hypothetical protein